MTPAERVRRLRGRLSHDRFADKLKEHAKGMGMDVKPTRQRVIGWEAGKGIGLEYAPVLADMEGSRAEFFRPLRPVPPPPVHREVASLRAEVAEVRDDVSQIRRALEQAGIAIV